jgi:hypothetical protein
MSSYWCDNPREHEREGRRDYERHGRYGYDSQQYNDHWDDCAKHYRQGFDEARREDERRQEAYEEEMAERRRHERQAHDRWLEEQQRESEEEYYERQQWEEQQYAPEPNTPHEIVFSLLPSLNWPHKRIRSWARLHGVKLKDRHQF